MCGFGSWTGAEEVAGSEVTAAERGDECRPSSSSASDVMSNKSIALLAHEFVSGQFGFVKKFKK
jgi:hypothetical protein